MISWNGAMPCNIGYEGFPVKWRCLTHNMIGFYSSGCPTCAKAVK